MNKKTTLLSLKCLFVFALTQMVNGQQIYTNGGLSTGVTANNLSVAPAGYTWSEVQNETANTTESNTNAGYGATYNVALTTINALADDFVVPVGAVWNVTSFDVFAYQTGNAATAVPFDQLRLQIYNGDPAAGGTVIAGNFTANVMDVTNSGDALMYRIFNSTVPTPVATGTTRKIWRLRGNLTASLPAGTYWIAYQAHATNDQGAFFPSVTIPGTRGLAGWNAKQSTLAVPAYTGIFDAGNPATAADVNQDLPFLINGTVLNVNENSFEASITLSPNPVKNMLFISAPTDVNINAYEIMDLNGKVVKALNGTTGISEIDVNELAVGNYILKLKSDNGIASKKFIKE
jgi:hypothetical protein